MSPVPENSEMRQRKNWARRAADILKSVSPQVFSEAQRGSNYASCDVAAFIAAQTSRQTNIGITIRTLCFFFTETIKSVYLKPYSSIYAWSAAWKLMTADDLIKRNAASLKVMLNKPKSSSAFILYVAVSPW